MEDQIVRITSRLVAPFIQVYGIYVILHGHLSPGGGFSGGAIFGASLVLIALSFNLEAGVKQISHQTASVLESGGALGFTVTGLIAIALGGNYLANRAAGFPLGEAGQFFSSGAIMVITVFVGIKVASTITTLFYNIIEKETPHGNSKQAD
ncbi:MAG: MnhB domain-containing protein [Dethiobacteria bacterium]|nr:MnhB domain-containing protein [Bacillota bacterium]MDW7728450.1 MnhB domain-containing protein [Bacillota bacterium]